MNKNGPDVQEPLVESKGTHFVLVGLGVMMVVTMVIILALLVVYVLNRRSRKYRTLNENDFLKIEDDSGSDMEIFIQKMKKGYTSVDTIDHDTMGTI